MSCLKNGAQRWEARGGRSRISHPWLLWRPRQALAGSGGGWGAAKVGKVVGRFGEPSGSRTITSFPSAMCSVAVAGLGANRPGLVSVSLGAPAP